MPHRFLVAFSLLLAFASAQAADLFTPPNLAAWCIVPFDAKKRGPEERAAMLEKLGIKKFVYDYRAEHIPQWDDELTALKKHGIELFGWWFPTTLNDEAKKALELFKRHGVRPQLWVNGNGGPLPVKDEADQKQRITKEAARLKPICEAAAPLGCQVALYNHGSWYGEPENAIAIIKALQAQGIRNVGMVYNLHHGHGHLERLAIALPRMLPHLLCLNLNGMDTAGDTKGRKILPIGAGTEDVKVLKTIRDSGYQGIIGILNHTNEDAEGRLQDNLTGLRWVVAQVEGKPAGRKPTYRTWQEPDSAKPRAAAKPDTSTKPSSVPSLSAAFGMALQGGLVLESKDAYRTLPISIECRAKLNSKESFNILIASGPKSSSDHWELYSYAKSGVFSLYLPGRGGDFRTSVNIADGAWHDLVASIGQDQVMLYVDGKLVLEKATAPLTGKPKPGGLAFGRLVEGGLGCDGLIDDVRISRGPMKPRKGDHPRQRMDNTLGLWSFDNLDQLVSAAPEPAAFAPDRKPLRVEEYAHWQEFVNRERVFDYYAKQAVAFRGKPLPALIPAFPGLDGGQQGHWGNQNDQVTWKDGRFAASDLGTVFSSAFKGPGLTVPKAVCIRLGDRGELSACYDPQLLDFPLVWKDGFIKLSDARHGFMGGGQMNGVVVEKRQVVKPSENFAYHGYFRHGKRTLFAYRMGGEEMLDAAWSDGGAFQRKRGSRDSHEWRELTKGGPAQWPQWLETKGTLGTEKPFATDTITIPFDNPHGTLFFISGHDFFRDGSAALATMTGEVWLVRGIDADLQKVRWKRYATGLHQPLGVKIVDDQLYVLGRDQITRLVDLNNDDEADFYECVSNIQETSPGGHDYITGLDRDAEGRFYFASGNQGVCRVSGTRSTAPMLEVLATGFRNPNGLGLSPDGRFITTSVQEGDWTPASQICQIEIGKNQGAHFGAGGPKNGQPPEPPLMYLPRGEDNSSGGQCFITTEAWQALRGEGNLAHFSPGTGSAWLVSRQQIHGRWQGAAVRMSASLDSGAQAGRFHPVDGHLYVSGMQGWGSYTPKDGCFQRLRYVGGVPVMTGFEARDNGVLLRFDTSLVRSVVTNISQHFAQRWNYRYSAAYGSPELSVKYADTPGHDPLEIRSAHVLQEGKALFLEIPQLIPASTVHLHVQLTADSWQDVFLTVHGQSAAFTEFPGYQPIAKVMHAAATTLASTTSAPNPWAKGEQGRALTVEAALGLQFVQKQLSAKAGEAISLTFKNPDVVPHNWMLIKPGTLQSMGNLVNLMITDPKGLARHYVPESEDVLVYTDMVNPSATFTIHFEAPKKPGEYPYLCTFPGHWMVMNGVLKVE